MADDSKDFDLNLKTTADTTGAKEAKKAVEELSEAVEKNAEATGEVTDASEEWLDQTSEIRSKTDAGRQDLKETNRVLSQTEEQTRKVGRESAKAGEEQKIAGKKSSGSARGILEASRAFEDLQYGIRGVLNNIPGIVQGFGGGALAAGAFSFAAVGLDLAVRKLGPLFAAAGEDAHEFTDSLVKGAEESVEALDRIEKAQDDVSESIARATDAKKLGLDLDKRLQDAERRRIQAEVDADESLTDIDRATANASIAENEQSLNAKKAKAEALADIKASQKELVNLDETLRKALNNVKNARSELKAHDRQRIEDTNLINNSDAIRNELVRRGGTVEEDQEIVQELKDARERQKKEIDAGKGGTDEEKDLVEAFEKANAAQVDAAEGLELLTKKVAGQQLALTVQRTAAEKDLATLRFKNEATIDKVRAESEEKIWVEADKGLDARIKKEATAAKEATRQSRALGAAEGGQTDAALRAGATVRGQLSKQNPAAAQAIEKARQAVIEPGNDAADQAELIRLLNQLTELNSVRGSLTTEGFAKLGDTVRTMNSTISDLKAQVKSLHNNLK